MVGPDLKAELTARRVTLRRRLAEAGGDLLAVAPGDDFRYLLGFTPLADERACYLLVGPAAERLVMPSLNALQAEAHTDLPMVVYADAEGPEAAIRTALGAVGAAAARTLMVGETMRADHLLALQAHLPGAAVRLAAPVLGRMRLVKTPAEIAALKAAAALADRAVLAAAEACRPGVTELDVAGAVNRAFLDAGADEVAFAIIASGPNGAFPHHHTGPRRIEAGDAVVCDLGCRLGGYPSDVTRMVVLGDGPAGYSRVHAVVEDAVQAGMAAVRPGVPARAVDAAARGVIERAGYGPYFTHRTGHGLGVSGHEPPWITGTNDAPLEPGMVFSIEPGIYLPGRFGVRLEDIVVVTDTGCERLSALPRDAIRR